MTAAFLLVLAVVFVYLAKSGKWSTLLAVVRNPGPPPIKP